MSLLLMVLVGCGDDRNERLLAGAEACMEMRADSARRLLQQVDSVLPERQQAHYALLWTQAMHKCRIPLEGDSLINVAVDYYAESGDRHRLAKSLLYKGLVHKQQGEVEAATEAFVGSEQAFEGVEDDQYKALLFGHYASLLFRQNLFDKSLDYYKRSYICKLKGDSIHYIVSACSDIATIYELLGQSDSAKIYYERGMQYRNQISEERYSLFAINYATFLIKTRLFVEAEHLLQKSESQMSDSTYIYNVYSSFATLYYETGEYEKARRYGEKMLESPDSLMQCGGYLHLYRIHKRMGNMNAAVVFHDRYRRYDSDITLRRKTAEVAEIPHKMKALRMESEARTAHRWQWTWGIGVVVVLCMAVWVVKRLSRKHGTQMKEKDSLINEKEQLLAEKRTLLQEIEKKLYDLKIELGRLKGTVANQSKAVENLKDDRKRDKAAYNESIKEFKKNLKERDAEYKAEQKTVQEKYRELTKRLNLSEKEQARWINEVKELTVQMEQYELLQRFLLDRGLIRPVLLILELKSGQNSKHYTIRREEYATLLKQLAEYAYPGIRKEIETNEVLKDKQELTCLLLLGFDDMEMLRMATNLKPNSVRTYRTQIKATLEELIM